MSYELACQLNGRIAAIASVAGLQNVARLANCSPQHPTPILHIHGTTDGYVPYLGSAQINHWASVYSILSYWVRYNGCAAGPTVTSVPDIAPHDGCTAEHLVWTGGRNGSVVEHYRISKGGHSWPGAPDILDTTNFDISASTVIWRFLRRFRLNELAANAQPPPALSAWPNPLGADGVLYLRAPAPFQPDDVRLYNVLGQQVPVVVAFATDGALALDSRLWTPGLYYVQVTINHQIYRRNIVR